MCVTKGRKKRSLSVGMPDSVQIITRKEEFILFKQFY